VIKGNLRFDTQSPEVHTVERRVADGEHHDAVGVDAADTIKCWTRLSGPRLV